MASQSIQFYIAFQNKLVDEIASTKNKQGYLSLKSKVNLLKFEFSYQRFRISSRKVVLPGRQKNDLFHILPQTSKHVRPSHLTKGDNSSYCLRCAYNINKATYDKKLSVIPKYKAHYEKIYNCSSCNSVLS